jgi:AAA+ ATPase superfamily predicted ATPase
MALESKEKNAFAVQDLLILEALALLAESSLYNAEQRLKRKRAVLRKFNPYQVGSPVYKPEEFYGRHAILTQIISSIHNNHYFIRGERRIGKTSLLLHLKHQLEDRNDPEYNFYPIFYDLQGIQSTDFYTEFMRRIIQNQNLIDLIPLPQRGEPYDHFQFQDDLDLALTSLTERANGKMIRMIVLMDEIQKIDDLNAKIPEQLRRILLNEERVKIVMVGVEFFKQRKTSVSPFNIYVELELRGFEEADARKLITQPVEIVFNYQEETIHKILKNSDLKPMRIQQMCQDAINHMHQRIEKDPLTEPIILLEDLA